MRLKLHPDSRCEAVNGIDVSVLRESTGDLLLEFQASGDPDQFIPDWRSEPRPKPKRTDDLWKHTCFEAFVKPAGGEGYFEFNFAPSCQWAAYRFSGYRRDRQDADIDARPEGVMNGAGLFYLRARLALARLPDLAGSWRLGLAAVIEEANGRISYWALAHPPGRADFHQTDGFALELPAI